MRKIKVFKNILSEKSSESQRVYIHMRPERMPALIWVQTVCKGDQQMTLAGLEFEINRLTLHLHIMISLLVLESTFCQ